MNRLRRLLLASLLVLSLWPVAAYAKPTEESMLERAREQYRAGNYYFASTWMERILRDYPASSHREEVLSMIYRAFTSTGRDAKAAQALGTLQREYPKTAESLAPKSVVAAEGHPAPAAPERADASPARAEPAPKTAAPAPAVPSVPAVAVPVAAAPAAIRAAKLPTPLAPFTPAAALPAVNDVAKPAQTHLVPVPTPAVQPAPEPVTAPVTATATVRDAARPVLGDAARPIVRDAAKQAVSLPASSSPPAVQLAPPAPVAIRLVAGAPSAAVQAPAAQPGPAGKTAAPIPAAEPPGRGAARATVPGNPVTGDDAVRYTLQIGPYAVKSALANASKRIKKAGLEPVVEQGAKKNKAMVRLHVGEFPSQESARKELDKLSAAEVDGFFLLEADRKFHVYAGSYSDEKGAAQERQRLAALGIALTLKQVVVALPNFLLTAGSFPSRLAASAMAEELERQGVNSVVVERPIPGR